MFECLEISVKDLMHLFRRTFAAHAVRQGILFPYTQAIAGWSTPHVLDQYTATMDEEKIEAFRKFKLFGR